MVAITDRPAAGPRLADLISPSDRAASIRYVRRLTRLLALEPGASADLTTCELCRLRHRAVVTSVRALTELDAGEVASALLRETGRRQRLRAVRRRASVVART